MAMDVGKTLALTAVGGLMAGLFGCNGGAQTAPPKEPDANPGDEPAVDETAKADPCCKGKNECKGQGMCNVEGKQVCKSKNECKGQGGCCPPGCDNPPTCTAGE